MVPKNPPPGKTIKLSRSVVTRLSLTLVALLVIFGAAFLTLHYQRARSLYLTNTDKLIGHGETQMKALSADLLTINRDVVINSVDHTTELYRRRIEELPFALYRGEENRIKEAIGKESLDLSRITVDNTDKILQEVGRRTKADITRRRQEVAAGAANAQKEYFRQFRNLSALFVSLAAVLLAGGLGMGLYRWVLHPVRALEEGTRRLAAGDLDYRIPLTRGDELGRLAGSFNRMSGEIQAAHQEVATLNANLEQEVAGKTEELRGTVDELSRTNTQLKGAYADLQATQDQLLRTAKMASIGRLAGGVAHEFGNLIGGILGCADMAKLAPNPDESHESIEMISRTARRAQAIVESLLRFARRRPPQRGATAIEPLVKDALTLLGKELSNREITTELTIEPALELICDADQLSQVLVNLLTNAIHALAPGGRIKLTAGREKKQVVLTVCDNGRGIPQKALDHIFEPFFTTKDGEGDSPTGTGLGLSVTHGIITDHDGEISVKSQEGAGTTFRITIPETE